MYNFHVNIRMDIKPTQEKTNNLAHNRIACNSLPEWAGGGSALFQVRNEMPCSFEESAA